MSGQSLDDLGDLQRQVLETVWKLEEANVAQVRDDLLAAGRGEIAYTTVLTVLQKLGRAGWLQYRAEKRVYWWRATRSRAEADSSTARALIRRVFGGDPLRLFQHLLDDEDLSDEELRSLRILIEQKRSEKERPA